MAWSWGGVGAEAVVLFSSLFGFSFLVALCERPAFGVFSICGGQVVAEFSVLLVFIEAFLVVVHPWQLILLGLLLLDCRWLLLVYSIHVHWRFQGGSFSVLSYLVILFFLCFGFVFLSMVLF